MSAPLEGIRVLDFGQYVAGPLTGMLLADQGADVIKVDPPSGPRWDTDANATWNRGKRVVRLDLKARDLEVAKGLVASADVLIENFRPGVMARLGLGADEALARNPRLLYCSLPGFAEDDPRASLPAWEGVVAAATGTYREGGGAPGVPVFTALPIASSFAAFVAANSVVAALYSRHLDGRGQRIEVPLFDAMFAAIGAHGLSVRGSEASGGRPNDFGGGIFDCADGRWVQISLAKPHFQQRFARAAGLEGEVDIAKLATQRSERERLTSMLPEVLKRRPADEWEAIGAEADLPLIKVRSAAEWIDNDHAHASNSIIEADDPQLGPTQQPNSPVRIAGVDAGTRSPRRAIEPTDIRWQGEPVAVGSGAPRRAALEGVRVIDLSQVLAGPMGGRTLAEFGADVVKINPPNEEGAGIRFSVHRYHTDVNRAKRSILLDLKRPAALDVFWRLLEDTDVVLHNFRPGVLDRLRIGESEVRRRREGLVYTSVTAYGSGGPWEGRPGYEPFGQAPTGVSARQGGDGRPRSQPFAVNDYGTGLMSAFAALLGLYRRARTGEGGTTEAALAYTGTILQSPYLIGHANKRWTEPAGIEARGWGPLQRLYRAQDGWFFLGARASDLEAMARIEGLDGIEGLQGADLETALERRLAERSVADWCDALAALGIGAHALVDVAALMQDPWVQAHGLSVTRAHDTGEEITTVGPPPRLSATPVVVGPPATTPGADGAAILEVLGLSTDLGALVREGALATS
ncbi:MAG: CoA transferase [Dehalococcoidia bacterium]